MNLANQWLTVYIYFCAVHFLSTYYVLLSSFCNFIDALLTNLALFNFVVFLLKISGLVIFFCIWLLTRSQCSSLYIFVIGINFPKLKSQEYENVPQPNWNNLLYCDFDDAKMEFCHWQGDPRNDKAHWKHEHMTTDLNNGIICLQPRNIHTYRLRKIYGAQQNSLTARLWSETVEPVSTSNENNDYMEYSLNNPQNDLRCIQFQYKIQLHDSNVDPSTSNSVDDSLINLSLLKHSTG